MIPRPLSALVLALTLSIVAAGCATDADPDTTASVADETAATASATTEPAPTASETAEPALTASEASASEATAESMVRDSGLAVTVQPVGDLVVHSLTAPEMAFANSTHIIETTNALVVIDTQFLLPNATDFRAYADSLGKPIDRVFITHAHPDHFLGSEAFADLPVFALDAVSTAIAANGDAEVEEKQGDFGPEAIAGAYVVPEVVEPGTIEFDGVEFELTEVTDAEAEVQLVVRVPEAGVVATGDIVYSGIHLILAGPADTWTAALQELADNGDSVVLPGHGVPSDSSVFDTNIEWLATAGELLATVDTAEAFKQGLIDAFPDLGMTGAIDFVTPFLFPEE